MSMPKYPEIIVQLSNEDGNAFYIIGRVRKAMRRGHIADKEIEQFTQECKASDYDHLLRTCMKWVTCE